MNRKLILVILLSALMLFCFAWAYARHADQSKVTITKQTESKEAVKEQLKELGRKITATEAEVKLEDMPPLPHQGTVNKVPLDQLAADKVKKVDAEQTMQLRFRLRLMRR
jgi:hypothetical protein